MPTSPPLPSETAAEETSLVTWPGGPPQLSTLSDAVHTAPSLAVLLLAGEIAAMPLLDLLQLLARQGQSGALAVTAEGDRHLDITLKAGKVAQITAQGFPGLHLGRFVRELGPAIGLLPLTDGRDTLEEIAAQPSRGPLGQRLLGVGLLTRADLRHCLAQQTQALLQEALALPSGRFTLTRPDPLPPLHTDPALGAALDLDLAALLLEGFRRRHEWHLVQKDAELGAVYLPAEGAAGQPPPSADRLGLGAKEAEVLSLCNGRRTLAEIAQQARLAPGLALRILMYLQAVQIVRRRVPALAA